MKFEKFSLLRSIGNLIYSNRTEAPNTPTVETKIPTLADELFIYEETGNKPTNTIPKKGKKNMEKKTYVKYHKVSHFRSIEESKAKNFMLNDKVVARGVIEKMTYAELLKAMKAGKLWTAKLGTAKPEKKVVKKVPVKKAPVKKTPAKKK